MKQHKNLVERKHPTKPSRPKVGRPMRRERWFEPKVIVEDPRPEIPKPKIEVPSLSLTIGHV